MSTAMTKHDVTLGLQLCDEMRQVEQQRPLEIGNRCKRIRDENLYPPDSTYADFIVENTGYKKSTVYRFISYTEIIGNLCINSPHVGTLSPEGIVRPLSKLEPELQKQVWEEATGGGRSPTAEVVKQIIEKTKVHNAQPKTKQGKPNKNVFNFTNENIDWAKWSWNPVTGCRNGCQYCYARDIGMRFDKHFNPTEHLYRLSQPKTTVVPEDMKDVPGIHNVFVCSMADLFGDWVPEEWITKVLNAVRDNPQWNYIFLTKNPKRLAKYEWPDHAWVGTTIDTQERVGPAEAAFQDVHAKVKFISSEPLSEELTFKHLDLFNWVIIGGRSKSSRLPAAQPEWKWVESLLFQARNVGCRVYFKPNLTVTPKEYPGG